MGGAFLGYDPGQAEQAVLGRDIRRLQWRSQLGVHRTHVDDGPTLLAGIHVPQAGAGGEEGAVDVDRHQLFPVGVAEFVDGIDDLDAGVGDQHIDRTQFLDHVVHALIDLGFAGHIHANPHGASALGDDLLGRGLGRVQVDIGNGHCSAVLGIDFGNALAQAAGGSGDDGDFPIQFHGNPPDDDVGQRV